LIGVKWRFFDSEKAQLQFGIYPQLLVTSRDHARGLGQGRAGFVLPLLAQKTWDKWTTYGNVGVWWQNAADTQNYFYAGAVLARQINEHLELGVELFGNSPKERGGRSDVAFNIGGHLEIEQASQPALRWWTRHCGRYTRDGLHLIAASYKMTVRFGRS